MATESSARRNVRVAVRARPTRDGDDGKAEGESSAAMDARARSKSTLGGVETRTAEEREEEYRLARERIFGVEGEGEGAEETRGSVRGDASMRALASAVSASASSSGGESGRGMSANAPAFTPRGGKATMKNKLMDLFDPDFRRAPRGAGAGVSAPPRPAGPPPMPPMPPPMPPRFAAAARATREQLADFPPLGAPAPPPPGHPPPSHAAVNRPPSR